MSSAPMGSTSLVESSPGVGLAAVDKQSPNVYNVGLHRPHVLGLVMDLANEVPVREARLESEERLGMVHHNPAYRYVRPFPT